MNTTYDLYEEIVNKEVMDVGQFATGSDEHRKAVSDLSQLTDRLIKMKEVDLQNKTIEMNDKKLKIEQDKIEFEKQKILDIEREKQKMAALESEKLEIEREKLEMEKERIEIEKQRSIDDRKAGRLRDGLNAMSILVPAGITLTGMVLMFIFEEKGTITSGAGRKIVDRIFRTK